MYGLKKLNNMKERMIKYITSLSEEERLVYLKKQSAHVLSCYKKREKALLSELNYTGSRTGVRGGKITTLQANSTNKCEIFDKAVEDLKLIIRYI